MADETVADFLARGGRIIKCPPRRGRGKPVFTPSDPNAITANRVGARKVKGAAYRPLVDEPKDTTQRILTFDDENRVTEALKPRNRGKKV